MLIKESNKDRIEDMIREAEGRSRERLLTFEDVLSAARKIEKSLGIKKKDMEGIKGYVDVNAQDFPRAYRFRPMSTHFELVRKKSGWDLTRVYRDYTRRDGHAYELILPDTAKEALIDRHSRF